MVWWLHLITRRVDTLRRRCEAFERVARAVGSFAYVDRTAPLLLCVRKGGDSVTYETVNSKEYRAQDLPVEIGPRMARRLASDGLSLTWVMGEGRFVDYTIFTPLGPSSQ